MVSERQPVFPKRKTRSYTEPSMKKRQISKSQIYHNQPLLATKKNISPAPAMASSPILQLLVVGVMFKVNPRLDISFSRQLIRVLVTSVFHTYSVLSSDSSESCSVFVLLSWGSGNIPAPAGSATARLTLFLQYC